MRRIAGAPLAPFRPFEISAATVVCDERFAAPMRAALARGSLYDFARSHPAARSLAGRGAAYAVPLPGDETCVVVRHNRHGGLLASITGDVFRWPSRAPIELEVSRTLHAANVPTPQIVGYVLYPVLPGFCRADVATVEVPASQDLSAAITSGDAAYRERALRAAARLVRSLSAAGARHHDLNVKNVLLRHGPNGDLEALALDVDRVAFVRDRTAARDANLARLLRSARKWRANYGAPITDSELAELVALARGPELASTRA